MPGGSLDGIEKKPDHEQEKIERLRRAMYSRSLSEQLHDKPRRELGAEQSGVGEDWVRPEPGIAATRVAPRFLGWTRALMRGAIFLAAAFAIGAVGFFGYYFLLGGGSLPASPGNIDIFVSGPLQISGGTPTELQIAVQNRNRAPLELANLVITYPKGTRSPTDLVTNLPSQRISLGTIESGDRRQGTVSAVFAGEEGTRADIKVELEYRLQGSTSIFVATTEYQMTFASSPLSLSIEGNTEAVAGQPVEFSVTVASNADAPVRDALLKVSFPFGFTLTSTDPKPEKNMPTLFSLGDLSPGQKKTVTIRGVVNGAQGDERVFRFSAGTRTDISHTALDATLADYAHHLTISSPFLGLSIVLNKDAGAATTVVGPGETVNVAVQYKNNLSTPITDAVIVAQLSGIDIDGTSIRSSDGFYRSSDNAVLWDKTTDPSLSNLAAGARGSVNFSFQMPSGDALKGIRDPKLTISVQAAGKRISETNVPETLQATAVQSVKLASDLQLIAQGLYYSNPFGSSGPMPPKANTETTYAIVLSVTNTTNEIKNGIVKATLPPYVRWIGIYSPSAENITFNQSDSTFTWNVGTIAPNVGVNGAPPKQAAIAIGFTPSTSQIGQQPVLVQSISLTGTDSTGQGVSRSANNVTTNIIGDQGFSPSSATVVK